MRFAYKMLLGNWCRGRGTFSAIFFKINRFIQIDIERIEFETLRINTIQIKGLKSTPQTFSTILWCEVSTQPILWKSSHEKALYIWNCPWNWKIHITNLHSFFHINSCGINATIKQVGKVRKFKLKKIQNNWLPHMCPSQSFKNTRRKWHKCLYH